MSQKAITSHLKRVLLRDKPFAFALFEQELQGHIADFILSKHQDNDHYFLAVTQRSNDVAMILIDENDVVHVNENARAMLRALWKNAYAPNMHRLIPGMAQDINDGYIALSGVKHQ